VEMIRKERVRWIPRGNHKAQVAFVSNYTVSTPKSLSSTEHSPMLICLARITQRNRFSLID
jgi:hypothetical protein